MPDKLASINVSQIAFEDNDFFYSNKRSASLCYFLKGLKIEYSDLNWDCQTRLDTSWVSEIFQTMADSNCERVYLGLENFDLLEKEAVVIDDVAFIGATLWTDMDKNDPLTMYYAKAKMRDYKHIRTGPVAIPWRQKLAPLDTMTDHRMAKEYIFPVIEFHKKEGRKVVVITPHLQSFMSITDELKGDNLNGAYASELGNEICDAKPDLWCHGHTHHSFDYMIGNTRIVCNPRGYVPDEPNKGFIDDLIIEI